MARRTDLSGAGVRKGYARGKAGCRHLRQSVDFGAVIFVEELEARVLLSHTAVAATLFRVHRPAPGARRALVNAPTGLTPAMVRQAYGFNQVSFSGITGDGSGQTIAIVDAFNAANIVSDLHAFDQTFGLADPVLTRINETGTASLPGNDPAGRGNSWALETSLDVEWAHVAAPGAKILLVEAASDADADLMAAVNTARNYAGVSVISMSWGGDEASSDASHNASFTTPAGHTGVTFVAASGDYGAYGASGRAAVGYPAASPNVVAVGGTELVTDSAGNYLSESGWGNGTRSAASGGSGGGVSRYEKQLAYQHGIVSQSGTFRALPDVSFVADPTSGVAVYDSWDSPSSPWIQLGGTSLATPLFAGLMAIADQGRALAGEGTLDGATETLPRLYAASSADFHDITTGNNGYAAGPGFDLVTGRGSPIVNKLAPDLVSATVPSSPSPAPVPVIGGFVVTPSAGAVGTPVVLTASNVSEAGGAIETVTFYRESNQVAGLQVGSDTLIGSGVKSGSTWTLTTGSLGLTAGDYTYYAVATDNGGATSVESSAVLTVTPAAPTNDNFAGGTVLTGSDVSVTSTNVSATREVREPTHAGVTGGKSVWFTWTAAVSGQVFLNTYGSNFDTLLATYTGNAVGALTKVASNDDASGGLTRTSALSFHASAGKTYHIAVDGYHGASGNIVLNLFEEVPPANNDFANATALTGSQFTWTGSNVSATRQTGEPVIAHNAGGASVWFSWVAPVSGTVMLDTYGSSFDTMLGVYTGTTLTKLTGVASNDDDPSGLTYTSALSFQAVAGTKYYFDVDGYNGASGSLVLNLVS